VLPSGDVQTFVWTSPEDNSNVAQHAKVSQKCLGLGLSTSRSRTWTSRLHPWFFNQLWNNQGLFCQPAVTMVQLK